MNLITLFLMFVSVQGFAMMGSNNFSVQGSINLGSMHGDSTTRLEQITNTSRDTRTGINAGVAVEHSVTNNLYLQSELMYSQKGGSFNDKLGTHADFEVDYIVVPVLLKGKFSPDKVTSPYLYAGPELSIKASSEVVGRRSDGTVVSRANNSNDVDTFMISAVIGGGIEYQMNSGFGLFTDLRYNLGLTNILSIPEQDLTLSGFQILGGVKFTL